MTSVLLINSNQFKYPWPVLPFGLCCIAAAVEHIGHQVYLLDLCFAGDSKKEIEEALQRHSPDIIGISIRNIDNGTGYNTQFLLNDVRRQVVSECKRLFSGPIIIGGPAVGVSGEEMLAFFDLEYAVQGDGELAMIEFIRRFEQQASFEGLDGLIIRRNGKIIQRNPPLVVDDLDAVPMPKPHKYLDLEPYRRYNVALPVQTKRGCTLNCSYCTYNRIEGRRYRLRSPQKIADEIESLLHETGINRFEFTDSTFNVPLKHAKEVLHAIIAKELALDLRTMGLNPGAVDEELADLMQKAGFVDVDLGAEAGCKTVLDDLGKNYSTAELIRAGQLLRERNIPVTWYLLLGAPLESKETLTETFETITKAASPWDLINIGVGIRVYNGSPIAEQLKKEKHIQAEDNFFGPAHVQPKYISLDEVKRITKKRSFRQPNFFMYDEDENQPLFVMRLGYFLLRIFAPRQPIWRFHILIRMIQRYLGIGLIKHFLYSLKTNRVCRSQVDFADNQFPLSASKNRS